MWNKFFCFFIITVPAFFFGIIDMPKQMGLSIVAGALAASFINIEKFQEFAGLGFSAKMNKVVEDAYATIHNLQELAVPLITSILDQIKMSGRFKGLKTQDRINYKNQLLNSADSLKISFNPEIKKIDEKFYSYTCSDLYGDFIDSLRRKTKEVSATEIDRIIGELRKFRADGDGFTVQTIEQIVNPIREQIDGSTQIILENYFYYKKNKIIKDGYIEE